MRVRPLLIAALIVLGLLSLSYFRAAVPQSSPTWVEIAWPFGRDAWPKGRAYRCASDTCDRGAELYVRPKLGFCSNCALGVADDEEVDRVTDVALVDENFIATAPGRPVTVAGMTGRLRHYQVVSRDGSARAFAALAVARNCDLIVALILAPTSPTPEHEQAAVEWLSLPPVTAWLQSTL